MGNYCLRHKKRNTIGTAVPPELPNIKVQDAHSSANDTDIMDFDTPSIVTPVTPSPSFQLELPRHNSEVDTSGSEMGCSPTFSPMSDSVLAHPSCYSNFDIDKKMKSQRIEPFLTVPIKPRPNKLTKTASDTGVGSRRSSGVQSCSVFHSLALEHSPTSSLPYPCSDSISSAVNSSILQSLLAEREHEFIWKDKLSIFCTTWNSHGKVSYQQLGLQTFRNAKFHENKTAPSLCHAFFTCF